MNSSREDYIQVIYRISQKQGYASNKAISEYLGISKPSVSEMLRKLRDDDLVNTNKNKITLSEKGKLQAQKLLSKHRLWEYFLDKVLHLDPSLIHDQADKLEHGTSNELFEALNAYLEYPVESPSGNKIFANLPKR